MRPISKKRKDAIAQRLMFVAAGLAFFSALALFGCASDRTATAPEGMPEGTDLSGPSFGRIPPEQIEQQLPDGPVVGQEFYETKRIDRDDGGTVLLDGIELVFPPKSLEHDTDITIVRYPTTPDRVVFDLLPHGIEFEKPVTLTIDVALSELRPWDEVTIYWWDPDEKAWVDLEADWNYPLVTVTLDHFSRYGTGRAGWGQPTKSNERFTEDSRP